MPTPDHGNFDLIIEVGAPAIAAAIRSGSPPAIAPSGASIPGLLTGELRPQLSLSTATLVPPRGITIDTNLSGTVLHVTNVVSPPAGVTNPPAPWLADVALAGVVHVTDSLELRSNAVVVDFTPVPMLGEPSAVAELDDNAPLGSTLVQFVLAQAFLAGGQTRYQQIRSDLLAGIRIAAEDAVETAVSALGTVVLAPAPSGVPITGSQLLVQSQSFHALYSLGGPAGSVGLVTRSLLLSSSVSGLPVDAAAICLNNTSLLRDFVRPAAATAFGVPLASFSGAHPCLLVGPVPVPPAIFGGPIAGIASVTLDSLLAGVDESGHLNITTRMTANGVAGSFSLTATVVTVFAITATVSGGALDLTLSPLGAPTVSSDFAIAWWVYVASILVGGVTLGGVVLAIDLFGGSLANGPIGTTLAGLLPTVSISTPLPTRLPPLAVRMVNLTQADAPRRMIGAMPDPFRSHDAILNLI